MTDTYCLSSMTHVSLSRHVVLLSYCGWMPCCLPCCACDCHLSAPFPLFLTYVYQNTAFAWPCQSQKRKTMPSFCQWQSSGGGHLCCVKYKHPHFLLVMTSLGHNGRVGGVRVDRSFFLWCMNKIQLGLGYVRLSIPLTNLHWKHHIIVSQYFLQ